jgi:hypothetical protein
MFGPPAVAEIYSNDIEACPKSLMGHGYHIDGSGRAFDSMPENDSRMLGRKLLPAAMRKHLNLPLDLKESLFVPWTFETIAPRPSVGCQCLGMTPGEEWMGLE